ncbi:MAG: hypothetical protein JRJ23_08420 [Deltaproteobacteria bacterium]|nr:hypothetical protein [Deltaproteobacteria bacterium]MBW1915208.1 hypothetical protein [Deltaproteobacteria bacterium]
MKKRNLLHKDESGAVLVISLVLLMAMTLLGLSSSRTASIEVLVAGNDKAFKEILYLAEAAVMENAQTIQNGAEEMNTSGSPSRPAWLVDALPNPNDVKDDDNWVTAQLSALDPSGCTLEYISHFKGVTTGESLDMTKESNLYTYSVYSRGIRENVAQAYIEIGYKRAF